MQLMLQQLLNSLNGTKLKYIIAGGFPRDLYYNKSVSDIDIFYFGDFPIEELEEHFGGLKSLEASNDMYINNTCTHKGIYNDYKVDFIKRSPLDDSWIEMLEAFPVSISQIGIAKNGTYLKTNAFIKTVATKVITYNPECSGKYLFKIKDKFPEMQLEMTSGFWEDFIIEKKSLPVKKTSVQYRVINHSSQEPLYREGKVY